MNSTVLDMQRIEAEAQALAEQYQKQIQELEFVGDTQLAEVRATFDEETAQLLEKLRHELEAEQHLAEQQLANTIAANKALVDDVLRDKKTQWVNYIVEKVVTKYGH